MPQPSNIHHHLYRGPKYITDPGNGGTIRVTKDLQICEMTSTEIGGETRILANPDRAGLRFVIRLYEDGGTVVVTSTNGLNPDLNQEATFADAGDSMSLLSVTASATTFRWDQLDGNVGSVSLA